MLDYFAQQAGLVGGLPPLAASAAVVGAVGSLFFLGGPKAADNLNQVGACAGGLHVRRGPGRCVTLGLHMRLAM